MRNAAARCIAAACALLPTLASAQDVAYVCTTVPNDIDGALTAAIHYPNGQSIALNAYIDGVERTEIIRVSAVRSLVPLLWELAEPVLDLPPEDVSTGEGCDPIFVQSLIVGFTDGTTRRRDEICLNGPISLMASEVIWARPHNLDVRDTKRDEIDVRIEDPAVVCGRQW